MIANAKIKIVQDIKNGNKVLLAQDGDVLCFTAVQWGALIIALRGHAGVVADADQAYEVTEQGRVMVVSSESNCA